MSRLLLLNRRTWHDVKPWLALCAAWFLFDLPTAVRNSSFDLRAIRPSADFLLLVTLYQVGRATGFPRFARGTVWLVAIALMAFRVDTAIFRAIMNEDPLLYDQLFVLKHTLVLISDLWSFTTFAVVLAVLLGIVLGVHGVRRALRVADELFREPRVRQTARAAYVIWLLVLVLSASHLLGITKTPLVRWVTPSLMDNFARSRSTYHAVQRGIEKSPHADIQKVALTRKPDVFLMLIESYGRITFGHPLLRDAHRDYTRELTQRLQAAGYHSVSAYITAPVRGGRSWLAEASLMVGAQIAFEAVLAQLVADMQRVPNLVGFFRAQGYETILLAASNRERPGIRPINRYRFHQQIEFAQLDYHGPKVGWGIVPDQYALEHTNEHVLSKQTRPVFLDFHMVSSHAPWADIPVLVNDYRELNRGQEDHAYRAERSQEREVVNNLRHYERNQRRGNYRKPTPLTVQGYAETIRYDLELLTRFAERDSRDRLYVLMGDHQPPLLGTDGSGFDSPIHVLARDPKLLEEFRARGFVSGMTLPPARSASLQHAGFLSLITRSLARCCGTGGALPKFRPNGFDILKPR